MFRQRNEKKLVPLPWLCYQIIMENTFMPQAQTVTQVTSIIRGILETELPFVSVLGEISNIRQPYSGHIYFTLKDAGAQLKAVLFKPQQKYLQTRPEDGMEVVCRGRISVYEPRGEYQLIVDYLDLKGSGALQAALERLKKKLADEGLFDQAHKKKIPFLPGKIAVVTSPQGAAVRDFLRIASARYAGIPITIFPVRVQGEGAADEIIQAINAINAQNRADVIVLCRGGGSIEDLWAFNEEKLARTIFASQVPIVSAIGHETDFTIADFVADLRVATPTAAAEAVIPNKRLLSARVSEAGCRMAAAMKRKIDHGAYQVKVCRRMLGDPSSALDHYRLATDHALIAMHHTVAMRLHRIASQVHRLHDKLLSLNPNTHLQLRKQLLRELRSRLSGAMENSLRVKKSELGNIAGLLDAVSPLAILARGYAIVQSQETGEIIRAAEQTAVDDRLRLTLHKGTLDCRVTRTSAS